ncbi:MAG: ornithine carbamoyltransferase [Candidatus Hodarchaeota archaeon]
MKSIRGKDFITLADYSKEEIEVIIETAFDLKRKTKYGEPHPLLPNKTLGMLFMQPSTRTRISFETGMTQLGGHAQYYSPENLQLVHKESWSDTAEVMSRYVDGIMIRNYLIGSYGEGRQIQRLMAEHSSVPIINGADDEGHPCQIMADLMTIIERFGPAYKEKKVVMSWVYSDRTKTIGQMHDMTIAAALLGMNLTLCFPKGYELDSKYMSHALKIAEKSGASIEQVDNLNEAAKGAHVIYAKSYGSLSMQESEDLKYRKPLKDEWRVGRKHFDLAEKNAIFMHSLPAAREVEATNEVYDGPMSVIYDQAGNRLHAQKGIMALIM